MIWNEAGDNTLYEVTKQNCEKHNGSQSLDWGSNPTPPKHEAEVLGTHCIWL